MITSQLKWIDWREKTGKVRGKSLKPNGGFGLGTEGVCFNWKMTNTTSHPWLTYVRDERERDKDRKTELGYDRVESRSNDDSWLFLSFYQQEHKREVADSVSLISANHANAALDQAWGVADEILMRYLKRRSHPLSLMCISLPFSHSLSYSDSLIPSLSLFLSRSLFFLSLASSL